MIINVIAGWTHKDKSMKINLRVIKVDKTLKKLGVPVNAEKEFYIIIMIVFIWIIFLLFLDISHIVSTEKSDDLSEKTMRSIILQHGHHVNILINAIFCLFVKHMKIRFKSLNKVLLDIFQLQDNDSKHKKNTDYKWAVSRRINFEKDFMKILHDVKRIHLELGILCREITKIYGIPIVLSMITAFINISSLILITYIIIIMSPQNPNFDKSVIVSSLLLWVIVFSLRIFVINYNCAECILEKARIVDMKNRRLDKRLEELGIKIDTQEAFNFCLIVTIAWVTNLLIINVTTSLWLFGTEDAFKKITAINITHLPLYISYLFNLTFGLSIRHMALRFRVVNQAIAKFEIQDNKLAIVNDFFYDKRRISNNRANSFQDTSSYLNHLLQIFREVHLELTKLCGKTTQIFGFQIVLTMLLLSALVTITFYSIYLTMQDAETSGDGLKILIYIISIISHCLNFLFVNHFCSETIGEWKRTGQIIHKLEVQSENIELCRTIQQFSLQMTQNPLIISPCGLIELGYSFVLSFVGTITTYLVILIQMSPQ
ncbi:hypothetical protein KQX54_005280 [Cotesia glomerata]|uniref:Gustatory receptor n=1 Tax=Cotesia glomerata TaxID=32391 RepID=A0AAV7HV02_COTGL|nr:hypothetical protein KQX54_005280 [Cotesia glomerata]